MDSEIERRLVSISKQGINLGLAAIEQVLERLNHPHKAYPSIIVGGTNGKGSVSAAVASILRHAGYKVGLYTSPHLLEVRERVKIDENLISPGDFHRLLDVIVSAGGENLTYFEILTALAFKYFEEDRVDMAVLEVGMGGRWDATNAVIPLVSVITNISRDHCEYLGSRLVQIAREKAGIVKEGGVCLTGVSQPTVRAEIAHICKQKGAKLYVLGRDFRVRRRPEAGFDYYGLYGQFKRLSFGLIGPHQIRNAALAVGTAEILSHLGFTIPEEGLRRGLEQVKWEGRLEQVCSEPLTLLDGAHNPAGISALVRALKEIYPGRRLIFVFGCLADKDYKSMLHLLKPAASLIILTSPPTPRARPAEELAVFLGKEAMVEPEPALAFDEARRLAEERDIVCVTGSLYLVGAIKSHLLKQGLAC